MSAQSLAAQARRPRPARRRTAPVATLVGALEDRLAGLALWSPRGLMLYLLPLPLLPALCVSLLRGDGVQVVGQLAGLAGCWSAAALARRGLQAEAVYHHRRIARRPPPRKTAAAALLGAGVFAAAWLAVGHGVGLALLLCAGSVTGFVLAYGVDPWAAKRPALVKRGPDADDALRTLEEAERRIARIEATGRRLANREVAERLERIARSARGVVDLLEDDPRDLRRARRFLHVYLSGAQDVSERYARTRAHSTTADVDDRFRDVLATIERVFDEQRRHLLEDEVLDLDVQIEVLSRQLAHGEPTPI
jgi:5-bromo-4-chloroindolyl phosphate hydrolysis protein